VGDTITSAGLHIKIPFIQEVRTFEKRLLVWDGDPNQIPTAGREFIWVDATARWRISDARKFLESVATEAAAQLRLDDVLDSSVRDEVSKSELVELVRSKSWQIPEDEALELVPEELEAAIKTKVARGREEITRTILEAAREKTPQYGIELVDVRIKRLDYVESVREKVYERMISERKRIAAQFRSEGEGRSAEILGEMERELRQIIQRLPPGPGGPGQGRRRGHGHLREGLQQGSRVLRVPADFRELQGRDQHQLGAGADHRERFLSLFENCETVKKVQSSGFRVKRQA
jgi:membrane protease subunit HflC